MDKKTIAEVWEALKAFLSDRTVILIDHAFADKQYFNRIFAVDCTGNVLEV